MTIATKILLTALICFLPCFIWIYCDYADRKKIDPLPLTCAFVSIWTIILSGIAMVWGY